MTSSRNLYAGRDPQDALGLLAACDHGHLTQWGGREEFPELAFLHYVYDPQRMEIAGHLAQGNPMLERLAADPRAVFTVSGASVYVPSYWVERPYGVPTSYYSWAQAAVEATLVTDPEEILADLRRLLARLQPEGRHPGLDGSDDGWSKLINAITGVKLNVRTARSRFKYGQNRTRAQRRTVVERLGERNAPGDAPAAAHVLERLAQGRAPAPAEQEGAP